MKIYKIIALLLIFLPPNILLAAKIDAKDPYNKLYKKECGCLKIKNETARYNCIITQFNCGTILETPSCITTDKHFNGYNKLKDDIEGVQQEIKDSSKNQLNNLIDNVNSSFKVFRSGIKIIRNGLGLIKDFMGAIQTIIKFFGKIEAALTGRESCNYNDFATIFNADTSMLISSRPSKNFIESLNRFKKCVAQAYITAEEGVSDILKIIDRIYDSSNLYLDAFGELIPMDPMSNTDLLKDNRYYNPRQEIKSIETRQLRKIRRKINKSNDDYASETFFDLKSSISYNQNIKESLSYGFLYTIAKTAKNDDKKTIGKKLNKIKKRRIVNGCAMLKNEGFDWEVAQSANQRIESNKLDIIRAKKCTFYLKEKYKELDKKIQDLNYGTKDLIKIIDRQIAKQKSIEDIINKNKKNIVKLRSYCQSNIENYFNNIDKQISYQDNASAQIQKIKTRREDVLEKIEKETENIDSKIKKTTEEKKQKLNTQKNNLKDKKNIEKQKYDDRIKEAKKKYNKKASKKLNSAKKEFIKQMDKFIAKIPRIIDNNVKAIESIKNIDKKYFGGRLGRMRHKHMKVDIKNLQRINSNYGDGEKICKYLLGGKNTKTIKIKEVKLGGKTTFDLTSEILCDKRKDINLDPNG